MKWASRIAVSVAILAVVGGVWSLRGRAMEHYLGTQTYEDVYYLPPPQWLEVMSLGHRRALADLIWLRALVYFGDEFANEGAVKHIYEYGESMLALDPDFRRVYRWVGMAGMYTPRGTSVEFMKRAIDVLRRGAERFPNDAELAWDTGAMITYELLPHMPKDHPDRESLMAEGRDFMMAAARLGGGPEWLVLTNASSLRKLGQAERELRHLEEMYTVVRDPEVKEQIRLRLAQLRTASYSEAFRAANEEFERRREEEFPYLPADLYFFVADPVESLVAFEEPG